MITVEKRDHQSQLVLSYTGEVIERQADSICLRAIFRHKEWNPGFVVFRPGDVFIEWFYSSRWYNIFQIHEGESAVIKGWYCNITRPAHLSDERIAADDLALDVFISPSGVVRLLDQDEFDQLELNPEERQAALQAVDELTRRVAQRQPPFTGIL